MILSALIAVVGLGILFVLADQLGKRLPSWLGTPKDAPPPAPPESHSGKDLIRNPGLLGLWMCEYVIDAFEWTNEIAPSQANCERLGLNEAERISCANEHILIRAVSVIRYLEVCGFSHEYVKEFSEVVFERVSRRMRERSHPSVDPDPQTGILLYLSDLKKEDPALSFCCTYVGRVYPKHFDLFISGNNIEIPLLAFKSVSDTMNSANDALEKLAKA